jgi:hypothetical protein
MQDCCIFLLMVYITVSGGQVIVTVNPLALLFTLTHQEFTLSTRDRKRPNETFIITILSQINTEETMETGSQFISKDCLQS